jgi:hypothetical protein
MVKTYLSIWFNTNGEKPSDVVRKLETLGFKATRGNYDHVYDWGKIVDTDEIIRLSDNLQKSLRGSQVLFKLETM